MRHRRRVLPAFFEAEAQFVRSQKETSDTGRVAIIGGGPAGLMAADVLVARGIAVDLYDAMPSLGRKFLMAGKSGLNLTHAEPFDVFVRRFGESQEYLAPSLEAFSPDAIRDWASSLGIETFVGTSGRVFPAGMKAAPLLRAWLRRLRASGLDVYVRHKWTGWNADGALTFTGPGGNVEVSPAATILALGGASWSRLGSDGAWVPWLQARGVGVSPLKPANCGFDADWSDRLRERIEGQPLKGVTLRFEGREASGECMVTHRGLEGGPVYALSGILRDAIERDGAATLTIDLIRDISEASLAKRLAKPRGKKSVATHLRRVISLGAAKTALLREGTVRADFDEPARLAAKIKSLPVTLRRARAIDEAISTAGGVAWDRVTEDLELKALPGVYVAGEMLDWDAPTGGYLLTACLATGRWAGEAVAQNLSNNPGSSQPLGSSLTGFGRIEQRKM